MLSQVIKYYKPWITDDRNRQDNGKDIQGKQILEVTGVLQASCNQRQSTCLGMGDADGINKVRDELIRLGGNMQGCIPDVECKQERLGAAMNVTRSMLPLDAVRRSIYLLSKGWGKVSRSVEKGIEAVIFGNFGEVENKQLSTPHFVI